MLRAALFALVFSGLVAVVQMPPARACCNTRTFDHAKTLALITRAEAQLATNDLDAAWETLHSTGVDFHFSTWRYLGDEADMPILWRGELVYGALVARSDGRLPPVGKVPESAAARRRKIWQTARGVRGMTPASWHKIAMDAATVARQTAVLAELQARLDAKRR